jgi:hypothetical protein
MSSSDNITRFKGILSASIYSTASLLQKQVPDTHYCFMLKSTNKAKCVCEGSEIDLLKGTDYNFFERGVAAIAVNQFITEALLKFAKQHKIYLGVVNVLLKLSTGGDMSLTLRDGNKQIRAVEIEELM